MSDYALDDSPPAQQQHGSDTPLHNISLDDPNAVNNVSTVQPYSFEQEVKHFGIRLTNLPNVNIANTKDFVVD